MKSLEDIAMGAEFVNSSLSYNDFWKWYSDNTKRFQRLIASEPDTDLKKTHEATLNAEVRWIFLSFQVFIIEFLAKSIETVNINRCYMRLYADLRKHDVANSWCADPDIIKDDEHLSQIITTRLEIRSKYFTSGAGLQAGKVYSQEHQKADVRAAVI